MSVVSHSFCRFEAISGKNYLDVKAHWAVKPWSYGFVSENKCKNHDGLYTFRQWCKYVGSRSVGIEEGTSILQFDFNAHKQLINCRTEALSFCRFLGFQCLFLWTHSPENLKVISSTVGGEMGDYIIRGAGRIPRETRFWVDALCIGCLVVLLAIS